MTCNYGLAALTKFLTQKKKSLRKEINIYEYYIIEFVYGESPRVKDWIHARKRLIQVLKGVQVL